MTTKERKELCRQIGLAIGVKIEVVEKCVKDGRLSEEALAEINKHLHVLELLGPVGRSNRGHQSHLTRKGKEEVRKEKDAEISSLRQQLAEMAKKFLSPEESEILRFGKWVLNSMALPSNERKGILKQESLVHVDDHRQIRDRERAQAEQYRDVADAAIERANYAKTENQELAKLYEERLRRAEQLIVSRLGKEIWDADVVNGHEHKAGVGGANGTGY